MGYPKPFSTVLRRLKPKIVACAHRIVPRCSDMQRFMRIISGLYKGRRWQPPAGPKLRPTGDRMREAIFSILGPLGPQTRVLDLFAGSGFLGLEALSRGALHATWVEHDPKAQRSLQQILKTWRPTPKGLCVKSDALRFLNAAQAAQAAQKAPWDLVFLDPPYHTPLLQQALQLVHTGHLLAHGAQVVCEHAHADLPPVAPCSLWQEQTRRYGHAAVTIFQTPKAGYATQT